MVTAHSNSLTMQYIISNCYRFSSMHSRYEWFTITNPSHWLALTVIYQPSFGFLTGWSCATCFQHRNLKSSSSYGLYKHGLIRICSIKWKSSMRKSLCVITYIHTTSSFLVLFIARFAFDTFVWFTAALLTVLRHALCNKRSYHITNTYSLNTLITNHMLRGWA